jgi:hypothetical protein
MAGASSATSGGGGVARIGGEGARAPEEVGAGGRHDVVGAFGASGANGARGAMGAMGARGATLGEALGATEALGANFCVPLAP